MELVAEKYKQTEVGLIPSDWDIFLLDELATKIGSGITPTGGSTVYKEDGRPFIRSQNIGWGNLLLDDIAFIDDEIHQTFPNTEIKFKDVFLNISGASIGRSSFANEKLVGGNVNQHVCIIRVIDKKLHPIYLNLFLLSNNGQKQIDSFQSGGNRQGLNIGQIKTFQIPVPPTIEEQTAIATALSDADGLINGLEKLIVKKRNIKQGAMQKLLQPKEGWEVKKLGDYLDYIQPTEYLVTDTEYNDNNQTPVLTAGKTFILGYTNEEHGIFKNLPVIIFDDFTTAIKYVDFPFKAKSSAMKMLVPKRKGVNLRFIYELMLRIKYPLGDHKRHWIGEYRYLEIILPASPLEQNKIATILSDMDAEIIALETKLEKYRKIKLGMMQNLLKGKIRLV